MERVVIDNKKMLESPKLFYKSREDYINPISGNLVWRKGSIYEMLKPGILLGEDNCCMSIEGHEDLFVPATEEEISTTDSFDKEGIMTFADGSQGRIIKIGSKKPEGKLGELLKEKRLKYSLRSNDKVEFINISDESVLFCVQLLQVIEKLLGQHIEIYKEN